MKLNLSSSTDLAEASAREQRMDTQVPDGIHPTDVAPPVAGLLETPVRARIALSGARAVYIGPRLDLAPHRNAAATLAIALEAPFEIAFPAAGQRSDEGKKAEIVLIPPGTLHHLRARGDMAFLYLDALGDDLATLADADLASARRRLFTTGSAAIRTTGVDQLCAALGLPRRHRVDARIADTVRLIDRRPQDFAHVEAAARLAGLSASRFQALFRRTMGVPFRRYRLWRRMAVVMKAVSEGHALTWAAHEAGFASSAHLSTTFKTMFGITPSGLLASGVDITIGDGLPELTD